VVKPPDLVRTPDSGVSGIVGISPGEKSPEFRS